MNTQLSFDTSGLSCEERFQKLSFMLDSMKTAVEDQLLQSNLMMKLINYDPKTSSVLDNSVRDDENSVDNAGNIPPVANALDTNSSISSSAVHDTKSNNTPAPEPTTNTNNMDSNDLLTGKVNEPANSSSAANDNSASTDVNGYKRRKPNTSPAENNDSEDKNLNSSLKLTNNISKEYPSVKGFHEIGGLRSIKTQLFTLVVLPKLQPQLYSHIKRCCSVLLYGPPGTGKTRLAHGLAAESGAALLSLSVGNILSAYVGETEKNIGELFEYLRNTKTYTLLFIDEIDSLCRGRTTSEADYTRRIKTELLCQLSRMEHSRNCVIIAATNCPWDLDAAFLRRFQKHVFVPLPTERERIELFEMFVKDFPKMEPAKQNQEQLDELIRVTDGFTGSDIANLVNDAMHMPLNDLEKSKMWRIAPDGSYEPIIDAEDVKKTVYSRADFVIKDLKDLPPGSVKCRASTIVDLLEAAKQVHVTVTAEVLQKYEKFRNMK